jgi:hypothetical protein
MDALRSLEQVIVKLFANMFKAASLECAGGPRASLHIMQTARLTAALNSRQLAPLLCNVRFLNIKAGSSFPETEEDDIGTTELLLGFFQPFDTRAELVSSRGRWRGRCASS